MTTKPTLTNLPAGGQPLLGHWNGQLLDNARYLQEVFAGTNADKVAGVDQLPHGGRNFLANGGLERWSKGDGPFTAGAVALQSADWWSVIGGAATRYAGATGNALRFVAGGGGGTVFQTSTEVGELRTRTVTFRARVFGAVVTASIGDSTGAVTAGVPVDATDNIERTVTATATIAAAATTATCTLTVAAGQTATIDAASLAAYAGPVAYAPQSAALDAIRNSRHYQVYLLSHRWRTMVANERYLTYVPFRGAPLSVLPVNDVNGNDIFLTFPGNPPTTDSNIDTNAANTLVVDWDVNGANVQIGAVAAGADTYFYGMKLTVNPRTT